MRFLEIVGVYTSSSRVETVLTGWVSLVALVLVYGVNGTFDDRTFIFSFLQLKHPFDET